MHVDDHKGGSVDVQGSDELIARLRSVRKGPYGTFVLWHDETGPSFWVHINNDVAYLHFFRDQKYDHPGFQPTGMAPEDRSDGVHFVYINGSEADGYTMPPQTLVSVDAAYKAATEFLKEPVLPASISWFEL